MENFDGQIDFEWIDKSIMSLLNFYSEKLGVETYETVKNYVEHDEYEMAYEGLFLDLISIKFSPHEIDLPRYLDIGISLKLNKESCFHPDFWSYLTHYINNAT